ncbi:MAG TPA: chemotaxis protein CheB [Stellaceae bacterium]|nr:chemotaxis protein CheB [Stellaceae bacterium]
MARSPTVSTGSVRKRSAVAIIGSAGGIPALIELLAVLPASFPFPIIVAQHLSPTLPSTLPAVLASRAPLAVKWAEPGERPVGGVVYVVPPGRRLVVAADGFAISTLPLSSRSWLACPDALLSSLAGCYGAGAVGIVLSGVLAVGIAGMRAIRSGGGVAMAQNRSSASFFDMPIGAIDLGKAELVFSPARIAEALIVLAEEQERNAA